MGRKTYRPILYVLHEKENYVEGRLKDGNIFYIDYEDFEKVSEQQWWIDKGYAKRGNQLMHRFVLGLGKADRYKIEVDHINRNRLDNRKSNLRIITRTENTMNKSDYKNNTSGVKGVKWNKKLNKWQVQISYKGKRIHLGVFSDLEEAKKVRLEAEKKYFKIGSTK